jgi:Zn-dependent protease
MFKKCSLGDWLSVPVNVHWSVFLFLLVIWFMYGTLAFLFVALSFFSIIPHEFGHILVSRYYGIGCSGVWLTPMGGIALLDEIPREPEKEVAIVVAGPAVNLVLAILSFALSFFLLGEFFVILMVVNLGLGFFNLLPLYPMDGGRILRACLSMYFPFAYATMLAIRFGQLVSMFLVMILMANGFVREAVVVLSIFLMAEFDFWLLSRGKGLPLS